MKGRGTPWTVYEIAALRDAFGRQDIADLARDLGRSAEGVARKARALGLRAPSWGETLRGFATASGLSRATVKHAARALGVRLERQVRISRSPVIAKRARNVCIPPAVGVAIVAWVAANRRASGRLPCTSKHRKETLP